jgi:hypothetical protein
MCILKTFLQKVQQLESVHFYCHILKAEVLIAFVQVV